MINSRKNELNKYIGIGNHVILWKTENRVYYIFIFVGKHLTMKTQTVSDM